MNRNLPSGETAQSHNKQPEETYISPVYYRGHGLHRTDLYGKQGSPVFIASAGNWPDMAEMLESVSWGTVIANDYATFDKDISEAPVNIDQVNERNKFIRNLSYDNDVTFHVGTAHQLSTRAIRLAAGTFRWGTVTYTDKVGLYPVEERGGLEPAPWFSGDHVRDDGTALVVCSDLLTIESYFTEEEKARAKRLFAVTEWAYSDLGDENNKYYEMRKQMLDIAVEKAGSKDAYYRERLEEVVAKFALPPLPGVNTVVVADKGVPGIDAYNAVFTRNRAT